MPTSRIEGLREWFLQNQRNFPWRHGTDPYEVWVSEVMLQQTRASVVVPYFNRWKKQFPTLESLAQAPLEEIFKAWEGLGYYSRARNLKKGAQQIIEKGGVFPSTREELVNIKGIGPYTAGAILSFAFHQRAAAVDGNVVRVVTRYLGMEGSLETSQAKRRIEQETLALLPEQESWVVMEGLIELGALVCLPKQPKCYSCPLRKGCVAFLQQRVDQIPQKKEKKQTTFLQHQVLVFLSSDNSVLIQIQEEGKVLGGLAQFPFFSYQAIQDLEEEVKTAFPCLEVDKQEDLSMQKESFTRYQVELHPVLLSVKVKKEVLGYHWHSLEKLIHSFSFSSGHRRILRELYQIIGASL